jgi:hypothetical protein
VGQVIANLWNRRAGLLGHRRIKVEEQADGRLLVTHHHSGDEHLVLSTGDPAVALAKVRELIEASGFPIEDWVDQAAQGGG